MRKILLIILGFFFAFNSNAQVSESDKSASLQLLNANKTAIGLTSDDISNSEISSSFLDPVTRIRYVYLNQTYLGIPVFNQMQVLSFRDGKLLSNTGGRLSEMAQRVNIQGGSPLITAEAALLAAIADRGLTTTQKAVILSTGDDGNTIEFNNMGISSHNITVKLIWSPAIDIDSNNESDDTNGLSIKKDIKLAWQVYIVPTTTSDYWLVRIDAANRSQIGIDNLTVYCDWGTPEHIEKYGKDHSHEKGNQKKDHLGNMIFNLNEDLAGKGKEKQTTPFLVSSATYRVIPFPYEAPSFMPGPSTTWHSVVTNPWTNATNPNATTLNWHTGLAGTDYEYSRGNNVWAYQDRTPSNNTGTIAKSASSTTPLPVLTFDFTPDYTLEPTVTTPPNQQFNITNLFYWNNIIHDIFYGYGFTEAGGNFQDDNLGRGGVGNDHVNGEAQDGSGSNNANFATPADGGSGRMQMYLWTAPTPDRDGDVDNGIIIHEYGHGISKRITGGPANTTCLSNSEHGGEGISDYFSLMLTQNWATATLTTGFNSPRGIGTYALNQPTTGAGIRPQRYCTNFAVNNSTYATIPSQAIPHGVGWVWCSMLWEVTWEIINQVGTINPNIYDANGGGGNTIALKLVMEGLRTQPCSPGFVDARNAILQADTTFYGGLYSCAIWRAFARRGVGFGALQGSVNSINDQTPSFAIAPACLITGPTVTINQAAGQADPTLISPINFTAVFSEPVINFTTGDVTISGTAGATTHVVTGSGTTYNVAVSGMTSNGTVIATIAAGVCTNAALDPNNASTSTDNTVTFNTLCLTDPIVQNNADAGPGSLRQAVIDACPGSTITFNMATVTSPITLTTGEISITKNLTIEGPGAGLLTISGNNNGRIFFVGDAGVTGNINKLRLTNGNGVGVTNTGRGGAVYNNLATMNLNELVITGNTAANGGGINTAGAGAVTSITNCSVSNNTTTSSGGALQNFSTSTTHILNSTFSGNTSNSTTGGGAMQANGNVTITNSTFSGNTAGSGGDGGAIIFNGGSTTTSSIINSTFTNNTAGDQGGGINKTGAGPLNIINTIIAGNNATGVGPDFAGTAISQGFNLIGKSDGSTGFIQPTDLTGTIAAPLDAMLGPLASNGGMTQTHALLTTSPAIDKGSAANNPVTSNPIITDQRNSTRPIDIISIPNAPGGNASDIGAFELLCTIPVATATPSSQSVCSGSSITTIVLSSTVGGTTFAWTRNNPGVTGIPTSGSGNISGTLTNTTNAPVTVTFTITPTSNGCSGSAITATVNVAPTPVVDPVANQTVCNGSLTAPVNFTSPTTGGTMSYSWTNNTPSIGLAASGTGNIASFTATNATTNPVTATITVTPALSVVAQPTPELFYYKFDGTGIAIPNLASAPPAGTATATIVGTQTQGGSGVLCDGTLIGAGNSGTTNYVNTGWATNLTGTSWSISFKTANIPPSTTLFYIMGDNTAGSFRCFTNGVAGANNWMLRGPQGDIIATGGATVAPHTTTFVYNSAAGQLSAYVDGVLVNSRAQAPPAIAGTGPFKVGAYTGNTGLATNGLMDEFRLYNRALTLSEIQSLSSCNTICTGPARTFTITVNPTPTITCSPNVTATTPVGSCTAVVNYTTTATGTPTPTMTYSFSGATTGSGSGTGTGSLFNIGVTTVTVTATNTCGTVSCSFTVTVLDGQLPVISTQPANRTVCTGTNATFSVTATNAVSYQWQLWNGSTWNDIAGATASTYTVTNPTVSQNTNSYRVRVIGLCTSITSTHASLYVNPLPTINLTTSIPPNLLPTQVLTITATTAPSGGSYVWFKDGVIIPGASGNTLGGLTVSDIGTYRVVYTDPNGCVVTSANVEITGAPSDGLYVYPVPNNGQFIVRFYNATNEQVTLRVIDAKGAEVYRRKVQTTIPYTTINVDLITGRIFASGVYVVEMRRADGTLAGARRIIVYKQ